MNAHSEITKIAKLTGNVVNTRPSRTSRPSGDGYRFVAGIGWVEIVKGTKIRNSRDEWNEALWESAYWAIP